MLNPPTVLVVTGSSMFLSWVLTGILRRLAIAAGMLDRPNERSSHSLPTPRGGGAAIVVTFMLGLGFAVGQVDRALVASLIGGGALVALLGFIDDRRPLPARWRFIGHVAAATACLAALGPAQMAPAQQWGPGLVAIAGVGAVVYVVWMINLTNFMDGIDGIAGIQSVTVCLAGALLWVVAGSSCRWLVALLLAGSTAGFLIWNFPPARIFMGDAGSGFLGLIISVLSLWAAKESPQLLWSWLILTAAFMTDATVTLIRRVLRGEKFYLAHRSHAYQYASRLYKSHKVVTLAFGAINVFWLFPWALAVALGWIDGVLALLIAYTPLVLLAFHYKAGDRAAQGDLA